MPMYQDPWIGFNMDDPEDRAKADRTTRMFAEQIAAHKAWMERDPDGCRAAMARQDAELFGTVKRPVLTAV